MNDDDREGTVTERSRLMPGRSAVMTNVRTTACRYGGGWRRRRLIAWSLAIGLIMPGIACLWAQVAGTKYRRAQLPEFLPGTASSVFFDDVFQSLVGRRPIRPTEVPADATTGESEGGTAAVRATPASPWAGLITAATLEDEVKSLKLDVDRLVSTPGEFAGGGYQEARVDFSLLAVLFAVVEQYDGDVRWKESAAEARRRFAHTAANLKAGGAIQAYQQSKQRKQDLDDLVRGGRLQGASEVQPGDAVLVDRTPLMKMLENRFESNLKDWTASKSEFTRHRDDIRHEAELTATLGRALIQPGMDDAEDDDYRGFAQRLERAARDMAEAVKKQDDDAARGAMTEISRSCTDCHADYR